MRHGKVAIGETIDVKVYWDDAYPLIDGSSCTLGTRATAWDHTSQTMQLEVTVEVTAQAISCDLKFDTDRTAGNSDDLVIKVATEAIFNVTVSCSANEVITNDACGMCKGAQIMAEYGNQFSGCKYCPAGEGNNANRAGTCTACTAGTYSGSTTACEDCPAGSFSNSPRATECEPCEVNHYSSSQRSTSCMPCAAGEYAPNKGNTQCLPCQGAINSESNVCELCQAGKYYDHTNNGIPCKQCPEGKYSVEGSITCTKCAPGSHEVNNKCEPCRVGSYQNEYGKAECNSCLASKGEYQHEEGDTICRETKPGWQLDNGDITKEAVMCQINTYSIGGTERCEKCDFNQKQYNNLVGQSFCKTCDGNINTKGECEGYKPKKCLEDVISTDAIGELSFPETAANKRAEVACTHGGYASRECRVEDDKAVWQYPNTEQCYSKNTAALKTAAETLSNAHTKEETIAAFEGLMVENGSELDKIVALDAVLSKGVDDETRSTMLGVIDNLLVDEASDTVVAKIENVFADAVEQLELGVVVESGSISMAKVESEPVVLGNTELSSDGPISAVAITSPEKVTMMYPAKISIPTTTMSSLTNHKSEISSSLIEIKIDQTVKRRRRDTSDTCFEIKFDITPTNAVDGLEGEISTEYDCASSSDAISGNWNKNVKLVSIAESGEKIKIVCRACHNTSFAIIMSAEEIADTTQSTVSTALNIINIVFLLLTFLCIFPFKQFRNRKLMQIQIQLCVALFLGHVAFIALGFTKASSAGCLPGVIIVQYLFLGAVSWSVCASITLYEKIVNALKSFGKQDKHYYLKCLIGCWFAPLFMVMASYMTHLSMDGMPYLAVTGELDGSNVETCWVAAPWKYVGFIIPVYLCLALNVVLFLMIARIIIKAGKGGKGGNHSREVKALVSISTTVCLPWLVALGMVGPAVGFFQWVFILVTAAQGPTMFVCYVIFQEDVISNIFKLVGKDPPVFLVAPKSTSKSAKSEVSGVAPSSSVLPPKAPPSIPVKEATTPPQQNTGEENIYSRTDEEAGEKEHSVGSKSSEKHLYESTAFTQHGKETETPVPAVENDETYENETARSGGTYPHLPQLV